VALFLAGERCLDAGGRLSDTAWICEAASGAVSSLWSLMAPGIVAAAVFVGIPVYFAVTVVGRRWLFRLGMANITANNAFESDACGSALRAYARAPQRER
jgi:hypothetical protein